MMTEIPVRMIIVMGRGGVITRLMTSNATINGTAPMEIGADRGNASVSWGVTMVKIAPLITVTPMGIVAIRVLRTIRPAVEAKGARCLEFVSRGHAREASIWIAMMEIRARTIFARQEAVAIFLRQMVVLVLCPIPVVRWGRARMEVAFPLAPAVAAMTVNATVVKAMHVIRR